MISKNKNSFVIGDIHGNYKGLVQCLERSKFDFENDELILLGDICDGYSQVYECVELLLTVKNLIFIRGNHDEPFIDWLDFGIHFWKWQHGGIGTLKSYGFNCLGKEWEKFWIKWNGDKPLTNLNPGDVPESHKNFFKKSILYYIDESNNCFVHGGFNRHYSIKEQRTEHFTWDRDLWNQAVGFCTMTDTLSEKGNRFRIKDDFETVFIGHTSTLNWSTMLPMKKCNIWNLDTGGGFQGRVTIMNVNTEEFFQSDNADKLYPEELGRRLK